MRKLIKSILNQLPYVRGLREQVDNVGTYPPGHFYSPIPNRQQITERLEFLKGERSELAGINLNKDKQMELLRRFQPFYKELPFSEEKTPTCRYYFNQRVFCYADAIFLYSFLRLMQPARIIEVGSGFSSAVMLDTVDRFFSNRPAMTFIEPYPDDLKRLLRPEDRGNVTVIEDRVQKVSTDRFAELQDGDLLFIDSSHVMKCGIDLQYLLFDVIPRLPVGVFVHFHDVFDRFEYPLDWLMKGWYWNEAYLLRAFLSYNNAWGIQLFGNYACWAFPEFFAENMPLCLKNRGGSLYIRRLA